MKTLIKLFVVAICMATFNPMIVSAASIIKPLDQITIRVRVNVSQSVELTIERNNQNGNVVITGEYVSANAGDVFASYLLDGSYLTPEKNVAIPGNSSTFWRIYFDYNNENNPVQVYSPNGGPSIKIECQCVRGIMGDNPCGTDGGCDTSGDSGGCVTCCATSCTCDCMPKEIKGGILFVEASILYFNGVHYEQM